MVDVLLGQAYYLRFDPKLWEAMQPYPPLGTLYAAGCLRRDGLEVAVFDAMLAESPSAWREALSTHAPAYAVLYEDSFNYLSKMCLLRMREAAFEMIEQAKRAGCTVIVSSSDATDHVEEYLGRGADFVLLGEGEQTLCDLLAALTGASRTPLEEIPGVAAEGFRGPSRDLLRDLDLIPFPARDLVDLEQYRRLWTERHGYFSLNLVTTRGCPYHCNWCAKPIYGQRYHSRSPDNVVEELAQVRRDYLPGHIWFCDDIFGLKPGWISRFAELVEKRDLQIPFKCLLRTDLVTEATARDLARAGCRTVWVGAESGSQKILDAMDKGATVQDTRRATRLLKKNGIEVGFFLQFGYPRETWEDIQMTLRMVRQCRPDDIGASVSYPLPGTRFHERVKTQLGDQQNWIDSNDLAMLYRGPFCSEFYRRLHRVLHKEFRASRAWRQLRRGKQAWRTRDLLGVLTLPLDRLKLRRLRRVGSHPSR